MGGVHNLCTPKTEYVGFQRAVFSGGCKTSGESAVLKQSKEETRLYSRVSFDFRFLSPKSPLDVRSTPDGAIVASAKPKTSAVRGILFTPAAHRFLGISDMPSVALFAGGKKYTSHGAVQFSESRRG